MGDGGGTGVVTADLATAAGLELPELSDALAAKLTAIAPTVITANPVDLAGAGEQDFRNFERVTTAVLESGEVDAVVFTGYFGGYSQMNEEFSARETEVAHAIATSGRASGRPLVAQAMFWQSPPARALREDGVPVYRDIEAAVGTLARLVDQELHARPGVADTGEPAPPVAGDGYFDARELLAAGGVRFTPALHVATPAEAREAAAALGYPVALKALGLLHKSDAGGVALGLAGVRGARRGARRHAGAPAAARVLGRGDGRHLRRRGADRRLHARPALRPDRARRTGRDPRGAAPRRRRRARTCRRRRDGGADPLARVAQGS